MTNITNLKNRLKTLPIIAVLALGFALAPASSMAANGDRGHNRAEYSKHSGKHQDKGHYRRDKHSSNSHNRSDNHAYKYSSKHHKNNIGQHLNGHNSHRYNKHNNRHYYKHNNHSPRYDRNYGHRGHGTKHYVVNDYGHNHHYGLDHLRFMIGLHTDNFDITFRD